MWLANRVHQHLLLVPLGTLILAASYVAAADVDFSRDVRPILADKCYACHGPDKEQRQTELRFDNRESAFADLGGYSAIVPGKPADSVLLRRITSKDQDEVMPPADHLKQLTDADKRTLSDWIQQGASWQEHWAYVQPVRRPAPKTKDTRWARGFIDEFILANLESRDIRYSREAAGHTLMRRLSFDLIGLPPDPAEVDAFVDSASDDNYEAVVDRLLLSPHFGEKMAMHWLDLVRYADTVGYHGDQDMSVSPFRDYVIDAFNANMRFDQFTREQLAGDLLESPTRDQLVASGYNKLGMMSAEGGVQPEEYLIKYASDRVRTASTVWMGSTLGCAECHDHKFDPFSTRDFYRFAAFFSDIKERGLYSGANTDSNWGPTIDVPDDELAGLLEPVEKTIVQLQRALNTTTTELASSQWDWEQQLPSGSIALRLQPDRIARILARAYDARSTSETEMLSSYFRSIAPELDATRDGLKSNEGKRDELNSSLTRTSLITVAVAPRETRVLHRGNWMDKSGDVVGPGVPRFLAQLDTRHRNTRLDLANWLVADDNPLTSRVFVNRLWKVFFGAGLSKSLDDVGSQGSPPAYPELLDSLAVEFVESGWNIKHMVKLIVMSSAYRQTSLMRDGLRAADPYNQLLARQSRFRIDAEMIRDNALAISGLLVTKIGGRSARPYQPMGLYRHLNFPKREYKSDTDTNQYRRGVYTHWQRQFLHPAMQAFDAPAREECTAERPRSNTPLAALVLLNDPSYIEAARRFAEHAIEQGGDSSASRIRWMINRALARNVKPAEQTVLENLLDSHRAKFQNQPKEAKTFITIGLSPPDDRIAPVELAAWTSVARTILNMHETVTRN